MCTMPSMKGTILTLQEKDLSSFTVKEMEESSASQISGFLSRLLAKFQKDYKEVLYLRVPSIMVLAQVFHCLELDVLDALRDMEEQSYCHELTGLDSLITLYDPHKRSPQFCSR